MSMQGLRSMCARATLSFVSDAVAITSASVKPARAAAAASVGLDPAPLTFPELLGAASAKTPNHRGVHLP